MGHTWEVTAPKPCRGREILTHETPRPTATAAHVLCTTHLKGHSEFNDLDNPEARTGVGRQAFLTACYVGFKHKTGSVKAEEF